MIYDVITRPGTCIQDGEQGVPLERVIRIAIQLPPGERLVIIARPGQEES